MTTEQMTEAPKEVEANLKDMAPMNSFPFEKYSGKETVIKTVRVLERQNTNPQYAGGSNKYFSIETEPLGKEKNSKNEEYEVVASEKCSILEDGDSMGWPANGKMAKMLHLYNVKNPKELMGKVVNTCKCINEHSHKEYLGFVPGVTKKK